MYKKIIYLFLIAFLIPTFLISENTFEKFIPLNDITINDIILHNDQYYMIGQHLNMDAFIMSTDTFGNIIDIRIISAYGTSSEGMSLASFDGDIVALVNYNNAQDSIVLLRYNNTLSTLINEYRHGATNQYNSVRAYDMKYVDDLSLGTGFFICGAAFDSIYLNYQPFFEIVDTSFFTNVDYYYSTEDNAGSYALAPNIDLSIIGLIGYKECSNTTTDMYFISVDGSGTELKRDSFGDGALDDVGYGIDATPTGFCFTGNNDSLLWVINYDYSGQSIMWERYFFVDPIRDNIGKDIKFIISSFEFVVGGYTGSSGGAIALKLDGAGNDMWVNYYTTNNGYKRINSLINYDSAFVFAGTGLDTIWAGPVPACYLLKTNWYGEVHSEWYYTYGEYTDYELANGFSKLPEGGFLLGGWTDNAGSNYDMSLCKVTPWGELLWFNNYGLPGYQEKCYDIIYSENIDKYLLAGSRSDGNNKQALVYIINPDGSVDGTIIRGDSTQSFSTLAEYQDNKLGGFILVGSSKATTKDSVTYIYVVKTDNNFTILWTNQYIIFGEDLAFSASPYQTTKALGGFILVGSSKATTDDDEEQVFIMNIEPVAGNLIWSGVYFEGAAKASEVYGDKAFVTGYSKGGNNVKNVFVMSVNISDSTVNWTTTIPLNGDQEANDIYILRDTIFVAGYSSGSDYAPNNDTNPIMMRFDLTEGIYQGYSEYIEDGNQVITGLALDDDRNVYLAGWTDNVGYYPSDMLLIGENINYMQFVGVEEENLPNIEFHDISFNISNSINFNNITEISFAIQNPANIKLKLYDITGREVRLFTEGFYTTGYYSFIWDGKDNYGETLSKGIYFCNLSVNNLNLSKKVVLIK